MGVTPEDAYSFSQNFQCVHWREIWYVVHLGSCEVKLGLIALSSVHWVQLDVCLCVYNKG